MVNHPTTLTDSEIIQVARDTRAALIEEANRLYKEIRITKKTDDISRLLSGFARQADDWQLVTLAHVLGKVSEK